MINLAVETKKIFDTRDESLATLQKEFSQSQQDLINGEGKMREDHEAQLNALAEKLGKELAEFIAGQDAAFKMLQDDATAKEVSINDAAAKAVDALSEKYQAELLAENEKAQAKAAEAADVVKTETQLIELMRTMTAEEIADKFGKPEVKLVAGYLGQKVSGTEITLAKRVVAALKK